MHPPLENPNAISISSILWILILSGFCSRPSSYSFWIRCKFSTFAIANKSEIWKYIANRFALNDLRPRNSTLVQYSTVCMCSCVCWARCSHQRESESLRKFAIDMQISSGAVIQFNVCFPYWFNTWLKRQHFLIRTQMTLTSLGKSGWFWTNENDSMNIQYIYIVLPLKSKLLSEFEITFLDLWNAIETVNSAHKSKDLKSRWWFPLV